VRFRRARTNGSRELSALILRLQERLSFGAPWEPVGSGSYEASLVEPLAAWEMTEQIEQQIIGAFGCRTPFAPEPTRLHGSPVENLNLPPDILGVLLTRHS
jgi:hypothetical protein